MAARKIALADGSEYVGEGFGAPGDKACKIVFTSLDTVRVLLDVLE